jgi:PiT family inorganic phosphate transporter
MSLFFILFGLALVFGFLNGFSDSKVIVATIISSRVLSPRWALFLTAISEFAGATIFGLGVAAVARTIGTGLILPGAIGMDTLIAALAGAILWSIITWLYGIPNSSSHTLVGGLIGAAWVRSGLGVIQLAGLVKILLVLFLSPLIGMAVAYLFTKLVFFLSAKASMRINSFFKNIQIFTGLALAFAHGANDPQKPMGIISLGLIIAGVTTSFEIPVYAVLAFATIYALGDITGGSRLIATVGSKFYKIRPVHGFCSQVSSALVVFGAALIGGPVSSTQVISSTVLGAGSAQRVNMVRWGVVGEMLVTWLMTIPITGLISAGVLLLMKTLALR